MFSFIKFPFYTKFMFFRPDGERGKLYNFSSDLEKVGSEWDIQLANGAYVEPISEPMQIERPRYGTISVIKVKADVATDYHTLIKEFWIPTTTLIRLDE